MNFRRLEGRVAALEEQGRLVHAEPNAGRMPDDVLVLAHEEILRLRARQIDRIASVRARSAGMLGASGIAASLVAALSNPLYIVPISCFALAAVFAVRSMSIREIRAMRPKGVLSTLVGTALYDARLVLIKQVNRQYEREETELLRLAELTRTSMTWFVTGVILLLAASMFGGVWMWIES